MKKKNLIMALTIATMLVSSVVGLTACGGGNNNDGGNEGTQSGARDVYAMSALSSVAYLSGGGEAQAVNGLMAAMPATARPTNVTEGDIDGILNCLTMFDGMITGGGVEQTVKENTSEDPMVSGYPLEMVITLHNATGAAQTYSMYFRELATNTQTEIDDGVEEIEVSTTFEGVIVYGEEYFIVAGEREVETEGNERETSLEFRTYKNVGVNELVADENNYVVIEQSAENTETEYEYTFYENGRKVREVELEYEETRSGAEVSFEWENYAQNARSETEYTVRKGGANGAFQVAFEKNGAKDTITVEVRAEGGYTFRYTNGFEENVG